MLKEQKKDQGHHEDHHVIFVGEIKEEWDQDKVLASDIMAKAGDTDPNDILEALDKKGGKVVKEFKPTETVDLDEKDRKFFRITAGGGGYS
jgi:hypothetical protein